MNLNNIRISSYLFGCLTNDDKVFHTCIGKHGTLDLLNKKEHLDALIIWLRKWGCRNLHRKGNETTSTNLKDWFIKHQSTLNSIPTNLLDESIVLSKDEIISLFSSLEEVVAVNKPKNKIIRIGPTASSKILFALRPNYFAIWDSNIRLKLDFLRNDGNEYYEYLSKIYFMLNELNVECKMKSTNINEILETTERKHRFYPKIIEEYFFVKYAFNINIDKFVSLTS